MARFELSHAPSTISSVFTRAGAALLLSLLLVAATAASAHGQTSLLPAAEAHGTSCSKFHEVTVKQAKKGALRRARKALRPQTRRKAVKRLQRRLLRKATKRRRTSHRACHAAADTVFTPAVDGEATVPGEVGEPVHPEYFGSNGQFFYNRKLDPRPLLRSIADAGLSHVRVSGHWHRIERNPPEDGVRTYDWSELDARVRMLAEHDLRLYKLLTWGTKWASPHPDHLRAWRFAPRTEHFPDFAAWAAASARRYGENGTFWKENPDLPYLPVQSYEVWNETNHSGYAFRDDPERYADLYAMTKEAIEEVDPDADVIFTPHSFKDHEQWLGRAFAARPDLRGEVDSMAIHLYGGKADRGLSKLATFRQSIDRHAGEGVPIEITEDGNPQWPENDFARAVYLRRLALDLPRSGCGVTRYILFSWWTPELEWNINAHWFGIADAAGELKDSGEAFVDAAQRMLGTGAEPPLGGQLEIC